MGSIPVWGLGSKSLWCGGIHGTFLSHLGAGSQGLLWHHLGLLYNRVTLEGFKMQQGWEVAGQSSQGSLSHEKLDQVFS